MKIRFTTESGSLYELDQKAMTWERLEHSSDSIAVRTKGGMLLEWPEVNLGQPVRMFGPGLVFGTRFIETTPVTGLEVPYAD